MAMPCTMPLPLPLILSALSSHFKHVLETLHTSLIMTMHALDAEEAHIGQPVSAQNAQACQQCTLATPWTR
jgi:hypothetical protein